MEYSLDFHLASWRPGVLAIKNHGVLAIKNHGVLAIKEKGVPAPRLRADFGRRVKIKKGGGELIADTARSARS